MKQPFRIVVCVKQVVDPEVSASSFSIDSHTKSISAPGVPPVMNPYDEYALKVALKIKDQHPDTKIKVVSLSPKPAEPVMLKALAVGADELYLAAGGADFDSNRMAAILAGIIAQIGFDLILAGRQAADTNMGVVGLSIASRLNIQAVAWAKKVAIKDGGLFIERVLSGGYEILQGKLPALITVSHESGDLRIPRLVDIKNAKAKPVHRLAVTDIGIDELPEAAIVLTSLGLPDRERNCRLITGHTPREAGENLARLMIEDGVL